MEVLPKNISWCFYRYWQGDKPKDKMTLNFIYTSTGFKNNYDPGGGGERLEDSQCVISKLISYDNKYYKYRHTGRI